MSLGSAFATQGVYLFADTFQRRYHRRSQTPRLSAFSLALLTGASEEYPDTPSQARDGGWDVALMGERLIPTTLLHRRDRNLPGTSGCLTWPDHDFDIVIEGG